MADLRFITGTSSPTRVSSDGSYLSVQGTRDGAIFTADWYLARVMEGRVFGANVGVGTTPVTFAAAYDANGPDFHLHVPSGTTVIPWDIQLVYDAVGTELTLEIIGLASSTGDSSVTGTASTIYSMRMDAPYSSNCTATGAVDAGGVTDPNAGNFIEFWREQRPLTDTVASGENDRQTLKFGWSAMQHPAPAIVGSGDSGSALTVYGTSQAGTGFITAIWVEVPSSSIV
jgi:hypothetical protein